MFPVIFVKSQKGRQLIKFGRYTFYKHSQSRSKMRWACSTHYSKGCKASIFTAEGHVLSMRDQHNHPEPELKPPPTPMFDVSQYY
ncbi:hypothetical protein JYU34_004416 [Plutella xylostella]|uniref:FLYWCH-type domain-containing protein n=1 Tax=Plutella xylostella TaxID=51655 RepID=A0ABQ7QXX3_PLUXY|nr:hypothetical protein JYU34_004416 [Plutella xylostella]